MTSRPSVPRPQARGDLSPAARNIGEWLHRLDRLLRLARIQGATSELVQQNRARMTEDLLGALEFHAPVLLRITPIEIHLREEPVFAAPHPGEADDPATMEQRLPFLLYRGGLRGLTLPAETTAGDVELLLDACLTYVTHAGGEDDLVTLLWQSPPEHLRADFASLEQSLAAQDLAPHSAKAAAEGTTEPGAGLDHAWPEPAVEPRAAWSALANVQTPRGDAAQAERADAWRADVASTTRELLARDDSAAAREDLALSLCGWLCGAMERCDWHEAWQAYEVLAETDPRLEHSSAALRGALASLDAAQIADRLDDCDHDTVARFFALTVELGLTALDLVVGVLARAGRPHLRAATSTALMYTCGDDPRLLEPYLRDPRWHVVRNIVFIMGQIGGASLPELLAAPARHVDARVRREVIHALGQAPLAQRTTLLLQMFENGDPATLDATLALLTRTRDPRVSATLLRCIERADFEAREPRVQHALLTALADVAGDESVPALEVLLHKGGWFARRTPERLAVAQALLHIGTPLALEVLDQGTHATAEAVRGVCHDVLQQRSAA